MHDPEIDTIGRDVPSSVQPFVFYVGDQAILFDPQKDITAYELARIIQLIDAAQNQIGGVLYQDFIDEHGIARHLRLG